MLKLSREAADKGTSVREGPADRALQQPARLVGAGGSAGKGGSMGVGTVLVAALTAVQLFLEVASRSYAENFSGFHDHEHWPGYCLAGPLFPHFSVPPGAVSSTTVSSTTVSPTTVSSTTIF